MGRFDNKVAPSTNGPKNKSTDKNNKTEKKPFDKKTWRLQKYSKKYKLEQWEEKRKKAVLREYYKEIKDEPKIDVQKIYEQYDSDNESPQTSTKRINQKKTEESGQKRKNPEIETEVSGQKRKNKAYNKAQIEFERLKQEKSQAREERAKQKQEREEALKLYKKKKNEKYKKLNKKTKRGQPIMKDRIEMLLEKIQSS